MSVLFPKVNKMPDWDYRPIYYDKDKERRKQKLAELQAKRRAEGKKDDENQDEYVPTLHRGSFRQAHEQNQPSHKRTQRVSRITFWIALLAMLLFCFYYLL